MSVHASHNPFACEPVIINDGSSNGLVSTGEWTYIDNILTYQVGFSWRILPSLYANTQVWEEFIPLAAPGTKRDDIIVGNIFNTFERIQGQPGVDSWAAPTVPPGKVLIQTLTVTENGVEAGNPNLGSNFITKEVYSNYVSNIVGITNGFKLHETRRNLVIGEGNITEIEGFVEAENSGIYPNMYFSLENQSGGDIVLKHIGTLPIKMWFPKLEAYTLKNREKVWFTLLTPSSKRLIFSGSNMVSNSEGDPTSANQVSYDNTASGLLAETVQEAVDELANFTSYNIYVSQTTNIVMISFQNKVELKSLTGITNVISFVDFYLWSGGSFGTKRDNISEINSDINLLNPTELSNGYSVQFRVVLTAGQSLASAILKVEKI